MSRLYVVSVLCLLLATAVAGSASAATCELLFTASEPSVNLLKSADLTRPIPYDQLTPQMFEESLSEGIRISRDRIAAIKADTRKANFENTIEALMAVDEPLSLAISILSHFKGVRPSPEFTQVLEKWLLETSKFGTETGFDAELFARVKQVYDRRETLRLSREQRTILESTYLSFAKNGIGLPEADKKRIEAINDELISETQKFSKNLTDATDSNFITVQDESRLVGLPTDIVQAAKELANERQTPGSWVFSLQVSTFVRVLEAAEDRGLREEMWRLYYQKNSVGEFDNREHVIKIAQLRRERAQILGYPTYAHMATETRMAQTPGNVLSFIEKLRAKYRPAAEQEARELQQFAWENGFPAGQSLKPWDIGHYAEQLKTQRYGIDQEQVRPYFSLEAVHAGALRAAEKLFKIRFEAAPDARVWDPSVRAYRVFDSKKNRFLGFFYFDPYARRGKRGGAWMTTTVDAGEWDGVRARPHVMNVLNLAPPIGDTPALLTIDDVRTVFHELGHGLHGLLTKTRYQSTSGTAVERDFVEFPSQLNEEWGLDPETLRSFARHYQTGEAIPLDLVEKIRRAESFRVASNGLGQLYQSALDMAWYAGDISQIKTAEDVKILEATLAGDFRIYASEGNVSSTGFAHIFSGGYSAGYYSYKWADVLVADAFEYFKEKGLFDRKTAARYRREVLERGGSQNPSLLYRRFRGQEPDPNALLRREGLAP